MGIFSSVSVIEKEMGPYTLVYDSFVGDYKDTGPVFAGIHELLLKDGIPTIDGIGIYHDDPAQVPAGQRRSDLRQRAAGEGFRAGAGITAKIQNNGPGKKDEYGGCIPGQEHAFLHAGAHERI